MPVRVMPNVTLDEAIEASHAALVPCGDRRLSAIANRRPALKTFLAAFRDEFGTPVLPTVAMIREDAPDDVRTDIAVGGFRDAVCVSAIVAGWSMKSATATIIHSDAFDVYPWFLGPHDHLGAVTPAMVGIHNVEKLQGQSAPALGRRLLSDMDRPLLDALLARWRCCFVETDYSEKNLRLFRSLEMARAASKMPGGSDATQYDIGRVVALWVSAFEILAHDGRRADFGRVLSLLDRVQWLREPLKVQDRRVGSKRQPIKTNLAGVIYERLYHARNAFLHGDPISDETLTVEKCRKRVHVFAPSLFRLALAGFLNLQSSEKRFRAAQCLSEDAILAADEPPRSLPRQASELV
jgi:hypothetical protein